MDEILRDFLEFEKDEELFARKYKGVYYWQCIRFDIVNAVLYKGEMAENSQKENSKAYIVKAAVTLLKFALLDIKAAKLLKKQDILYFDQQNFRYVDSKQRDSYFDFFEFNNQYSVQRCFYETDRRKESIANDREIGVSIAGLAHGVLYELSKIVPKVCNDSDEDRFINELCDKIFRKFDVVISAKWLVQQVKDVAINYKVYAKYYAWLIEKISPKAIIVVCHYTSKLFPLYRIAHKKQIPVIELEHGLICNHDAYNYADLSAKGKSLPDFLFTYGDFWNQYTSLPVGMKAISVGNPYLENRRNKYGHIIPDENSIVFYSDVMFGIEQAQFAIEFYQKNASKKYQIFFKFHPSEYRNWEKKYPFLKEHPEIHIVPKEKDLYELLASAKHHVSVLSTVLFESVIFNVKRYVMVKPGRIQYIQPLIDIGLAKTFNDMEEFEKLIKEDIKKDEFINDTIWKSDARKNGLTALEKIINSYEIKRQQKRMANVKSKR